MPLQPPIATYSTRFSPTKYSTIFGVSFLSPSQLFPNLPHRNKNTATPSGKIVKLVEELKALLFGFFESIHSKSSPLLEIAYVLVRLDHVAHFIVNANLCAMS